MSVMSTADASVRAARQAAVVVAVGVACALHIGKLPVAIPPLQTALGLSLLQAGFLLSLVQLAGMALGLLVGLAADRLGPRRVMLAGLLLLALGSGLGALARDVHALLWTRALEGLGFLLAVLPAPGLLRLCVQHPPTLARALGWWGAYMPVGAALALLLGAPLIGLIGWRGLWALLAGVALGAAVLLWRVVPEAAAPTAGAGAARLGPRLLRTLSAPGPWLMALGFFCYSGQWLAVVGFLPTIYSQAGVGGAALGALSALAAGINMLGNVGAGRLLARGAGPGTLLATGYVAMALGGLVAFGAVGHPWVQYGAVLLFSCVGGLIPGTLFGLAVVLAPDKETVSTTVGWMQQWSALGQFAGPPLVAWLATQAGGWQWTGLFTGVCSLLGLALAWRLQGVWAGRYTAARL
jgi:MFS family permease